MPDKLAKDIKKGDIFAYKVPGSGTHGWIALTDAETVPEGRGAGNIHVRVKFFPDGGEEPRHWYPDEYVNISNDPPDLTKLWGEGWDA